jgi:hypothetical protein
MNGVEQIGLIAGSRTLPLLFAQEARKAGVRRIVAVAFENETDPSIANYAHEVVWLRVGQLGKMIDAFASRKVSQCVMLGQIAPKNLFDLRPDFKAMSLLLRLKEKNAHTIFGAIAEELKKAGVELIEATPWLKSHMPSGDFSIGPRLSPSELEDVKFGFSMAKAVSRLEIGQLVVVREGTVLAVEGFEGTDSCLTRGGQLAGPKGGAVAVKVAKENHDMRFDVPCVGAQTLQTCAEAKIRVLALESGKTLLLEKDSVEQLALKHRITVTAIQG